MAHDEPRTEIPTRSKTNYDRKASKTHLFGGRKREENIDPYYDKMLLISRRKNKSRKNNEIQTTAIAYIYILLYRVCCVDIFVLVAFFCIITVVVLSLLLCILYTYTPTHTMFVCIQCV